MSLHTPSFPFTVLSTSRLTRRYHVQIVPRSNLWRSLRAQLLLHCELEIELANIVSWRIYSLARFFLSSFTFHDWREILKNIVLQLFPLPTLSAELKVAGTEFNPCFGDSIFDTTQSGFSVVLKPWRVLQRSELHVIFFFLWTATA